MEDPAACMSGPPVARICHGRRESVPVVRSKTVPLSAAEVDPENWTGG